MQLIVSPGAVKAFRKMPQKDAETLLGKLQKVADAPKGKHSAAKQMTDHPGFRLRHGDWRAVYRLDFDAGRMVVDRVGKRGEIYR